MSLEQVTVQFIKKIGYISYRVMKFVVFHSNIKSVASLITSCTHILLQSTKEPAVQCAECVISLSLALPAEVHGAGGCSCRAEAVIYSLNR